jgi:hypothetical protein
MTSLLVTLYIAMAIVHLPLVYKLVLDDEKLSDQHGFYLFSALVHIPFFSAVWIITDILIGLAYVGFCCAEGVRWTARKLNI